MGILTTSLKLGQFYSFVPHIDRTSLTFFFAILPAADLARPAALARLRGVSAGGSGGVSASGSGGVTGVDSGVEFIFCGISTNVYAFCRELSHKIFVLLGSGTFGSSGPHSKVPPGASEHSANKF